MRGGNVIACCPAGTSFNGTLCIDNDACVPEQASPTGSSLGAGSDRCRDVHVVASGSAPEVRVLDVNVEGPVARDVVERAVRAPGTRLLACYRRVLATDANTHGEVTLHLVASLDGHVVASGASMPGDGSNGVRACAMEMSGAVTLPAAANPTRIDLRLAFLRPNRSQPPAR